MAADSSNPELVNDDFTARAVRETPSDFEVVGRVVHYNGTPNFNRLAVLLEPTYDVKPGQFLAAWHGRRDLNFLTVIQVDSCSEVNPNEDPQLSVARERLGLGDAYAREGVSTRIYRLVEGTTLEEFELSKKSSGAWDVVTARAPEALARAGDPIVVLPTEVSHAVIGGEPNPADGVHLGQIYGPDPVEVTLKPTFLQMHAGAFGNPGKGKSYLSGIVCEEALSWGVPILVLDINGEMAETANSVGGLVITLPDAAKFGLSLDLITAPELVSITPNVQRGTQYAELIELAHDRLKGDLAAKRVQEISFQDMAARIETLGSELKITPASVRAATSRLAGLQRDPLIGQNFDFISMLKKHRMVVLDCRYLSLRQTQLIAAAAARVLQGFGKRMAREAAKGDKEASKWFALFFIDEAHAVAPNDGDAVSTQVLYELARMGRHVRTGMFLSSQSPSDLDRSVLKRLQTRFVFALERDQIGAIGGVTADLGENILQQLPKLPRGICAVSGSSETVRHGFLLSVKARKTPVGGSTPSVFASRSKEEIG